MNERERFLGIAKGTLKGELFLPYNLNVGWFMDETLERWRKEGLPENADPLEFFGLDRVEFYSGHKPYRFVPPFEEELLSEDEETRIVRDDQGVTKRLFKRNVNSKMPQWLDYPVKTREDFERIKKRLDPRDPARRPGNWEQRKRRWKARSHPLGIGPGSFFGHTLQRWVGTENLCMLFCEEPGFVHEMLEYLEYFFLELLQGPLREVDFDFASFGEDIAYKGRSIISPKMFQEFIQPRYVKICECLRGNGVEIIFVDSDGYLDRLIPLWLEVGVNAFSPLEAAAGMDAVALKERYGNKIVLAGNIDKRALIGGLGGAGVKEKIEREAAKAKRLLREGGYFPAVDHSVPPDVSLQDYQYLLQALRNA